MNLSQINFCWCHTFVLGLNTEWRWSASCICSRIPGKPLVAAIRHRVELRALQGQWLTLPRSVMKSKVFCSVSGELDARCEHFTPPSRVNNCIPALQESFMLCRKPGNLKGKGTHFSPTIIYFCPIFISSWPSYHSIWAIHACQCVGLQKKKPEAKKFLVKWLMFMETKCFCL